jgi:feruloyl-CoA synthase
MSSEWTAGKFASEFERRPDGTILLRPTGALGRTYQRCTDPLDYWAEHAPDQIMVARRGPDGEWQKLDYAAARERVRRLAGGLARLPLSANRPILILSGNGIEHLLLGLAANYVGIPYCPLSPAYSQPHSDLSKVKYAVELLTPGLVAAFGGTQYERAIAEAVPSGTNLLCDSRSFAGRHSLTLEDLSTPEFARVERAHAGVNPASIAKFLLTSGSTGHPKAVVTTHLMLCNLQTMLLEVLPFLAEEPPVIVDWLPWNHTYGGSHNVGVALFNGGTLYIDDGRPLPNGMATTVRNLTEISPTVYFNVPKGFDMLAAELERNPALRGVFFRRLRACFFGGAGLSQHTWDLLESAAMAALGRRVPIISGLGATETSPSVTFTTPDNDRAGVIGLPAAGQLLKLAPVGDKLEIRVKGPNVTPGYWRQPELTATAFDADGFYRLGDAVRLLDPQDPRKGLYFDGRLAEDFKLGSGTWVSVGPLRAQLLQALAPLALDVVVAGLNEDFLGLLIIPDLAACLTALALDQQISATELCARAELRQRIAASLGAHAIAHPGNSTRIERAVLLSEPPSLDKGEITDKGSINQRAVLQHRAAAVAALFAQQIDPMVITPVRR